MAVRPFPDTDIERPLITINDLCHSEVTNDNRRSPYLWLAPTVREYKNLRSCVNHGLPIGRHRFESLGYRR